MKNRNSSFIDTSEIQIGMFIELDLGWMAHPFPTSSFKVSSQKQIDIIAGLGLARVRYVPDRSDTVGAQTPPTPELETTPEPLPRRLPQASHYETQLRQQSAQKLQAQERSIFQCERRFGEALRQYRKTLEQLPTQPKVAAQQCHAMVSGFVDEMFEGESAIRLLGETAGEKSSMHPVNVTVLTLLLGKALGLQHSEMVDLGMAAFLHDVGKAQLPDRVRWFEDTFTTAETKAYQEHAWHGVQTARAMEVSEPAVLAISQHHEMLDGSGFPLCLNDEQITLMGKVLALVNRYDNLCNPSRSSLSATPHEALGLIFSQGKARFDPRVMGTFVRMMGVYPPGSLVQLTDGRYAMVVTVNASLPQKPGLVVYEAGMAKQESLILELEHVPGVSIRRSIKPSALPAAERAYLAPRQRTAYFFERVVDSALPRGDT
jgi:HD-GYP domain-containing protein (c-di-GMP phosphodiesterase class II)